MRCHGSFEGDVAVLWEVAAVGKRIEECLISARWRAVLDLSGVPWLCSTMIGS